MEKRFSPALFLGFLFCFALTVPLTRLWQQSDLKKDRFLIPPPEYIEYFHFGFNESMADSFWLRWVQDVDLCVVYNGEAEKLQPLPQETQDRLTYVPRYKKCDNSWAFKMLDTVSKLAPRFMMVYVGGATTLSVLIEDYEGASVIFDRGVKTYPNDWTLNYRAAYHFLYDRGDTARAAELLVNAADHGGPVWLKSLASRLYSRAGRAELGLSVLESYRQLVQDNPQALKEVDQRIERLRSDLKGP